ncbi:MAG TPA: hypothetical protein VMM38_09240 [Aridibacter sp.]|nr:hypothetical protein [Aridibacter sp.]
MPTQTNELKTVFSVDIRDAEAKLAAYEARLKRVGDMEARTFGGGSTGGGSTSSTASFVQDAQRRSTIERQATEQILRDRQRLERSDPYSAGSAAKTAAAIAVVGIALKGVADITQQSIERTIDADKANRSLSISAVNLGFNYRTLAEQNDRYADSLGRSRTQAAAFTSEIAKLATVSGRPADLGRLSTSLADIAAVRGISPEQIPGLASGIASGDAKAAESIGVNLERVYSNYAASVRRSVESLTDFEKMQARVNATLEIGESAAGANEARTQTLEGSVDRLSASWDNFNDSLSQTIARSDIVLGFLERANELLQLINRGPDDDGRKRAAGVNVEQIIAESNTKSAVAFDITASLLRFPFSTLAFGADLLTKDTDTAFRNFALNGPIGSTVARNDRDRRRLNAANNLDAITGEAGLGVGDGSPLADRLALQLRNRAVGQGVLRQLERERQQQKQLQERTLKTQREFQDLLASAREAETGNPFIGLFNDAGNAAEDAFQKFRIFGDEFGNFAAGIARRAAETRIALEDIQAQQRAFFLRQEAGRLRGLSDDEIGGRPARVSALQGILSLAGGAADIRSQQAFLSDLTIGALTPNRIQQAQQDALINRLASFEQRSRGVDALVAQLQLAGVGDFGVFGQEAIAQAKLALLPSEGELFGLVGDDPFLNFQAQQGLGARARLQGPLLEAANARIGQSIQRASITEGLRQKANDQLASISAKEQIAARGGEAGKAAAAEAASLRRSFISTAEATGIENLDRNQIDQLIDFRSKEADAQAGFREAAEAALGQITKLLASGVAVKVADGEHIVRIINEAPNKASVTSRPTAADTANLYDHQRSLRIYD